MPSRPLASEKALSMMRRTRGRTAQRPRQGIMFVAVSSVQVGPPATVTPGRLLASPVSPLKGQTDWVLSPSTTTRWPASGGVLLLWLWLWFVGCGCGLLVVVVVVVVVEWLYYSKRIIIVRWADLSDFFRSFSSEKCVFLFHVQ